MSWKPVEASVVPCVEIGVEFKGMRANYAGQRRLSPTNGSFCCKKIVAITIVLNLFCFMVQGVRRGASFWILQSGKIIGLGKIAAQALRYLARSNLLRRMAVK
ncbi:MAG: hypothetical protein GW808_05175 [Sphingomonadales bacterium]|nr:hypothetical protein [Sphingomonadales bacterium]PIX65355.1 MAG: hypothetical protein COZ43_09580 [Sphingomonadales bacterium CG_4_10_14_3_um_filter_58_15]